MFCIKPRENKKYSLKHLHIYAKYVNILYNYQMRGYKNEKNIH